MRLLEEYLLRLGERFQEYLTLMDKEQAAIREGAVDKLEVYQALERSTMAAIMALKRAVASWEALCPEIPPAVGRLQASLKQLQTRALRRNRENKGLLRQQMSGLGAEIERLGRQRGRQGYPTSPYADIGRPSLVDLRS